MQKFCVRLCLVEVVLCGCSDFGDEFFFGVIQYVGYEYDLIEECVEGVVDVWVSYEQLFYCWYEVEVVGVFFGVCCVDV